jgi:hypothetical protein
MTDSAAFQLPTAHGPLEIDVREGSRTERFAGTLTGGAGLISALAGAAMISAGGQMRGSDGGSPLQTNGAVALIAGAAAALLGLYLIHDSSTTVELSPAG